MQVRTVAVIGAGTMGSGIAQICAQSGWETRLFDVFPESLQKGMNNINLFWNKGIEKRKTTLEDKKNWSKNLKGCNDLSEAVEGADLVIEAIPEIMELKKDLFMCPSDYPYLYMNNEKTNILIGNKRHWRTINKTLCTFMTSKDLLNKYWRNFEKTCIDRNDPFEKYINEIYEKEICISPIKSLSLHLTNINSSYGLAPFIDYKKLWEENK